MLIKSLWVAMSTYSVIPVPQFAWNEDSTKYSICFFPVVGLFCGGGLAVWAVLCRVLGVGSALFAAVSIALPLVITGGIHMDGYMDTMDALSSHQSMERKLEIMKDHHCGAFAVMYCVVYYLLCFGLFCELHGRMGLIGCVCLGFVLSRSLSALCALTLPKARRNGMLAAVTQHAQTKRSVAVLVLLAAGLVLGLFALNVRVGGVTALLLFLWVWYYRSLTRKQFGGVTGDTAGFFLQVCELLILCGAWIGGLCQ